MPKEQEERLNPKLVLRRISELMPDDLPGHLRETLIALYAYSNGFLRAEDLEAGRVEFQVTVAHSQLAKFCHVKDIRSMRRRCEELRERGLIAAGKKSNKGNLYVVGYRGQGVETLSEFEIEPDAPGDEALHKRGLDKYFDQKRVTETEVEMDAMSDAFEIIED